VKAQTAVPINLTPVSDVIDSDVTIELEVRSKQEGIFLKARSMKTEELKLALKVSISSTFYVAVFLYASSFKAKL